MYPLASGHMAHMIGAWGVSRKCMHASKTPSIILPSWFFFFLSAYNPSCCSLQTYTRLVYPLIFYCLHGWLDDTYEYLASGNPLIWYFIHVHIDGASEFYRRIYACKNKIRKRNGTKEKIHIFLSHQKYSRRLSCVAWKKYVRTTLYSLHSKKKSFLTFSR
jgi:hypothetical protein